MPYSLSVSASIVFLVPAQVQGLRGGQAGNGKGPSRHPAHELSLAGLRPGRDLAARAVELYRKPAGNPAETLLRWSDTCRREALVVDLDSAGKIQSIAATALGPAAGRCAVPARRPWRTGRGLGLGDSRRRVFALYGQPDSRSPSTREGKQLELLYYAFDWAGPDVPQVMQVLCTLEKDGQPGRVVEITLAASSL